MVKQVRTNSVISYKTRKLQDTVSIFSV